MQRLADEQLKCSLGRFQLVSLILELLNPIEQLAPRFVGEALLETLLLELIENVAATRQVAQQHALTISCRFRPHVFVRGGVFQDRADVNAALVRESAVAHIRLIAFQG
jgi:hypothetical protein